MGTRMGGWKYQVWNPSVTDPNDIRRQDSSPEINDLESGIDGINRRIVK